MSPKKNTDSADRKKQSAAKAPAPKAQTAKAQRASKEAADASSSKGRRGFGTLRIAIAVAVVAVVAVVAAFYLLVLNNPGVPFATFKANLASAPSVAVVATYRNMSQFVAVANCATQVIGSIAHERNRTSISLSLINASNSTCIFDRSLGQINYTNETAGYCVSQAGSRASIFLNYSASNSTRITASRMTVEGDAAYLTKCPIAVDIS